MKVDLTPLFRFVEHLPKDGNEELALLKCHLLVEELLTKLIERKLAHRAYLPHARLSFFQKMWITRSLHDIEKPTWVWGALKRLNEARNALAHGLEKEEIQRKLDAFVEFVEAQEGIPDPEQLSGMIRRFQWAAFQVFSPLAAHAHFDPTTLLEIRTETPTLLTMEEEGAAATVSAESNLKSAAICSAGVPPSVGSRSFGAGTALPLRGKRDTIRPKPKKGPPV